MQNKENEEAVFERWFIAWVRNAYRTRGGRAAIQGLPQWSEEVNTVGREVQKQFLLYCVEAFRQAFLLNYTATDLVYIQFNDPSFDPREFALLVHGNNIEQIYQLIEEAIFHAERNGNGEIIFTGVAIKLTRLLHTRQ